MTRRKTTSKTTLVRQPRGGYLNSGGTPGNAGGPGRPRSEVREAALKGAKQAIPKLVKLLRSEDDGVVVRAADVLLKYGLGPTDALPADALRANLEATITVLREELGHDAMKLDAVLLRLRPIWA